MVVVLYHLKNLIVFEVLFIYFYEFIKNENTIT
jgi:hypothetical protein